MAVRLCSNITHLQLSTYVRHIDQKGQFVEIKMGNKKKTKIGGGRSVRFKLRCESERISLIVKYVPDASMNIL